LRGKHAELAKSRLARDVDKLNTGLTLGSIDKYLPLAYETPATIFDYLDKKETLLLSVNITI
jgi:transcription-repair coupling factor (superfamily II helicase)